MQGLKIGNLESKYPIIQGGMGVGISLSSLAGNVSRLGGIGCISAAQIGFKDKDYDSFPLQCNLKAIGEEIKKARNIANGGILAMNIMYATKNYDLYVKEAVKNNIDIIISGAGLPIELPELTGDSDTKIVPIVSSSKAANIIFKIWNKKYNKTADALIIEGPLAGGHLGFKKEIIETISDEEFNNDILKIINIVRDFEDKYEKKIPVIIAGGLSEKKNFDRFKSLGVDGFQIATKFVTTTECDADIKYKEAYINCKKEDIIIVKSPVGMPGRAIKNKFSEFVKEHRLPVHKCHGCIKGCNPSTTNYCITNALVNAAKGDIDNALLFCGANAFKETKIRSVSEVMEELINII